MRDRKLTTFVGTGFRLQTRSPAHGFTPVSGFVQGTLMRGSLHPSMGTGSSAQLSSPYQPVLMSEIPMDALIFRTSG